MTHQRLNAGTVVLLGMLTALATVVNNMYSPSMPLLMDYFSSTRDAVQLGLTASLLGLAAGQIIVGPLSDRYGRRPLLIGSMAGFTLLSLLSCVAPSLEVLYVLRFLLGITAGGGIVISRSVATDMARGDALVRAMAMMNVINGVAPIVTPMLGGWLAGSWGWTAVFAAMAVVGVILLMWSGRLHETNRRDPDTTPTAHYWSGLWRVWGERGYASTVLQQCGALMILFGNISLTPFLDGIAKDEIGYCLAVNGLFTTLGAGIAARRNARSGVRVAGVGMTAGGAALCAALMAGCGFWVYECLICASLFFVGMTLTSSSSAAMEAGRKMTGSASAMLGASGFVVGGITAPLMTWIAPAWVFLIAAAVVAATWIVLFKILKTN